MINEQELIKFAKELDSDILLNNQLKEIEEKKFTLEELNDFLKIEENISPVVKRILELENKGYLTREDSYYFFYKYRNTTIDDTIDEDIEPTEKDKLEAIERHRENDSKEEFEQFLKGLIDPQKNHTPKEWKDFLLKHKYIDSHGKIIYKRKRRSR